LDRPVSTGGLAHRVELQRGLRAVVSARAVIAAWLKKTVRRYRCAAIYAAPILLFVFPALARIEPAAESPWMLFGILYVVLAVIAWRALAIPNAVLFFIASFFALAAEASWSATHLLTERLGTAVLLYAIFGSSISECRSLRDDSRSRSSQSGACGAVVLGSLVMLLFLAAGPRAAAGCGAWRSCSHCSTRVSSSKAPLAVCRRCRSPAVCCRGLCSACGGAMRPRLSD
jgi:hypothetical protein